jgi:hypothetical protein
MGWDEGYEECILNFDGERHLMENVNLEDRKGDEKIILRWI